jgi:secreted trypsin-like serine protease
VCAGNQAAKQGSCKGDSGGPLKIFDTGSGSYVQIGIVAGSVNLGDCGTKNYPVVFTRLDHPEIYDFIESIVSELGKFILITG